MGPYWVWQPQIDLMAVNHWVTLHYNALLTSTLLTFSRRLSVRSCPQQPSWPSTPRLSVTRAAWPPPRRPTLWPGDSLCSRPKRWPTQPPILSKPSRSTPQQIKTLSVNLLHAFFLHIHEALWVRLGLSQKYRMILKQHCLVSGFRWGFFRGEQEQVPHCYGSAPRGCGKPVYLCQQPWVCEHPSADQQWGTHPFWCLLSIDFFFPSNCPTKDLEASLE